MQNRAWLAGQTAHFPQVNRRHEGCSIRRDQLWRPQHMNLALVEPGSRSGINDLTTNNQRLLTRLSLLSPAVKRIVVRVVFHPDYGQPFHPETAHPLPI